jgi:starch synthase
LNILFCVGEVYPYSKTGGLADVAESLPKALKNMGHQLTIITPFYQQTGLDHNELVFLGDKDILLDKEIKSASFFKWIEDDITYIFIKNDFFFNRTGYYGFSDDAIRFAFFNFSILEYLSLLDQIPDILHCNDWQTAIIPFLLDVHYKPKYPRYKQIKTLLSIHNLEKQGAFPLEVESLFRHKNFTYIHMGKVNFLKCGIMRANLINTVSQNYKNEILTHFYGFNLDGALKSRVHDLFSILNGLDQNLYQTQNNKYLYQSYTVENFKIGKSLNKQKILSDLDLTLYDVPLFSFIGRFARQKGLDLLIPILDEYLQAKKISFVVMGMGESEYELYFKELKNRYPNQVYLHEGFNFKRSHQFYAASDFFLLPSLFEPCGLNHMIAMKYGSLPIVRETGGLKDTVTPYNPYTGVGVGFSFKNFDSTELKETIDLAINLYHHDHETFDYLIEQAMKVNHSIQKMAKQYETLYHQLLLN